MSENGDPTPQPTQDEEVKATDTPQVEDTVSAELDVASS